MSSSSFVFLNDLASGSSEFSAVWESTSRSSFELSGFWELKRTASMMVLSSMLIHPQVQFGDGSGSGFGGSFSRWRRDRLRRSL